MGASKPRVRTIDSAALGICEYRLEGYDNRLRWFSMRSLSLALFTLCLLSLLRW